MYLCNKYIVLHLILKEDKELMYRTGETWLCSSSYGKKKTLKFWLSAGLIRINSMMRLLIRASHTLGCSNYGP